MNSERLLSFIEDTANRAYFSHPGRFADGALENILLEAGLDLTCEKSFNASIHVESHRTGSRTLHVVSEVYPTGGHSRVLTKWIQRDLGSSHGIVLTRQAAPVPDFLAKIWADRKTIIKALNPADSIAIRARQLKAISSNFDRVILHHHPDDAVPLVAFAKSNGCPVAMFNHAHFWFCLGSSTSDMIINTMSYFQNLTIRYRFPKKTALLKGPLGLEPLGREEVDKKSAKKHLGLPENQPVAMTIAQESYFKPMDGYDFFKTAEKLLDRLPDIHLVVVGVSTESHVVPETLKRNERLHLAGPVANPKPYYQAADICLESFPMSSLGAFVESVAYGEAFPVPVYGPGENVLRTSMDMIAKHLVRAKNEDEYLGQLCEQVQSLDSIREKAREMRRLIIAEDEAFGDQFNSLYQRIDGLQHTAVKIPETGCCRGDDNYLLASFTDPDIGRELDRLLPFTPAIIGNIQAGLRGYQSKRLCFGRVRQRCLRSFRKFMMRPF